MNMRLKLPEGFWTWNVNTIVVVLTWVFTMGIFYAKFEARISRFEETLPTINELSASAQKVEQVAKDLEPLRSIPLRVQSLEESRQTQSLMNVRREGQIDEIRRFIGEVTTQLSVASTKLDDINRRSVRLEDKVDSLTGAGGLRE